MQLIRPDININFVGFRYKAFLLSGTIILLGLFVLFMRGGLRMGVDFAGGTLIQAKFNKATTPDEIRNALQGTISHGFVQQIGNKGDNEYLIRTDTIHEELGSLSNRIEDELNKAYGPGQQVLRVEMVGPKVGHDLRQKALHAIFYAFLFIAVYISWRFEFKLSAGLTMLFVMGLGIYLLDALGLNALYLIGGALLITFVLCWFLKLPYALGALLSLVHDILITIGIFAFFNKEFSLEVFAALLTLSGYSLNDTIIVYDRIRENRNKDKKIKFSDMINGAINQTLSRTVLTSMTVFFVILCLFLLGGSVIHDFSFAMLIGVVTGSYSSVFVASPILIAYEELKKRKAPRSVARRTPALSGDARPSPRRAADPGDAQPARKRAAAESGEAQPVVKRSVAEAGDVKPNRNQKRAKKRSPGQPARQK
jgi:preprotein translocase subunit SecF